MNEKPHLHELEIHTGRGSSDNGVQVRYGDTAKNLTAFFGRQPSAKRVERASRKVVLRHDRGSKKLAVYGETAALINNNLKKTPMIIGYENGASGEPIYSDRYYSTKSPEVWGSDILSGAVKEEATA